MAVAKSKKKPKAKKASRAKKPAASARKPTPRQMARKRPETVRFRSASPAFTVSDLAKSLAWYKDVLGFVADETWEDGASVKAGNVRFHLPQDDFAKGRDRQKGVGFRIYCTTVQSLDALADGIRARGGKLDSEPQTMPWGPRMFAITDPDGFKITFTG
jgi:uncharacterized glyoxalase superfamily protein PhnB